MRTTSERLVEMLRSFGATPRQIFLKLSLPSATPFVLAGLKLGIGRGLIGVVVGELFGSRAGLGRLISQSADSFNMPELFAGVVVLAFAGIVMTAGFSWLEQTRAVDPGLSHGSQARGRELCKTFGDLEVLHDIDMAIEPGEFISIVGPSGCGKTTFLRIVAGLERAIVGRGGDRRPRGAKPGGDRGFVFQHDSLLPWRTVLANAMIGPEIAGPAVRREQRRTMDLLKLVGLDGFENYFPRQLSGGMRQRVNLARALGDRSGDPADGRAVLRARRADPRDHADRAPAHLGAGTQDRALRHPPDRRGGVPVRPRAGVRAPARPGAGARVAITLPRPRSSPQAHAGIRRPMSTTSGA